MSVPRTQSVIGFVERWAEDGFDNEADFLPIFADALEEAGYDRESTLAAMRTGEGHIDTDEFKEVLIPPELAGYDWTHTFAYAGEPNAGDGSADISKAADHLPDVSLAPFSRWEVKRVVAMQDGDNDGPDWVCVGELKDGRFFCVNAGCDYTGWG